MHDTERIELIVKLLVKTSKDIENAVNHFAEDGVSVITSDDKTAIKESGYRRQEDLSKILKEKVSDTNSKKAENLEKIIAYFKDLIYPKKIPIEEKIKSVLDKFDQQCLLSYSPPRGQKRNGYAVIINNVLFDSLTKRSGAEKDDTKMEQVLKKFNYEVADPLRNKTESELITSINAYITDYLEKQTYDSLIVVVSSHGNNDHFATKDGKWVSCWEIVRKFNLESLRGKPKIFLFNCCRGTVEVPGTNIKADCFASDANADIASIAQSLSDVLVCFSTVDDSISYRDEYTGSNFLTCIYDSIINHGANEDICTILDLVSEKMESSNAQTKQICAYHKIGFFKPFYLK